MLYNFIFKRISFAMAEHIETGQLFEVPELYCAMGKKNSEQSMQKAVTFSFRMLNICFAGILKGGYAEDIFMVGLSCYLSLEDLKNKCVEKGAPEVEEFGNGLSKTVEFLSFTYFIANMTNCMSVLQFGMLGMYIPG